jgi:hypothetical protein
VAFTLEVRAQATAFVVRMTTELLQRTEEPGQAVVRRYWEQKGPLYRQLAGRVVQGAQQGLRKVDAIDWSVGDFRKEVLSRAQSAEIRAEYERWFERRHGLLLGMAGRFWRYAEEGQAGSVDAPKGSTLLPAETRRSMGISDRLLASYVNSLEESEPSKRTADNLSAIQVMTSGHPIGERERERLARYSGFGGLSIDRVAESIPEAWRPDSASLIHEYYTPAKLCLELARILRPHLATLTGEGGLVQALEPAAGIGRFVNALSRDGFESVSWTAVEYSQVSSALLRAMRPDIRVVHSSFEKFVTEEEERLAGKLGLVVSNPPYGQRGASANEDTHPDYQDKKAYVYFLRRGLDLLMPGGIGVFLIPYGFLTGTDDESLRVRKLVLGRHHLMSSYRLPSGLFPGANIVTDLLLFRARGGQLDEVWEDDLPILEGRYYQLFPQHLLGTEMKDAQGEQDG